MKKYPKVPLSEKDMDVSNAHVEVEQKLVGEMWSNASGELAPTVLSIIKKIKDKSSMRPAKVKAKKQ